MILKGQWKVLQHKGDRTEQRGMEEHVFHENLPRGKIPLMSDDKCFKITLKLIYFLRAWKLKKINRIRGCITKTNSWMSSQFQVPSNLAPILVVNLPLSWGIWKSDCPVITYSSAINGVENELTNQWRFSSC